MDGGAQKKLGVVRRNCDIAFGASILLPLSSILSKTTSNGYSFYSAKQRLNFIGCGYFIRSNSANYPAANGHVWLAWSEI
jgi:hypothetical protein